MLTDKPQIFMFNEEDHDVFKLTIDEIDFAIEAINHHGYSAMLPQPVEWADVISNRIEIRDYIKELDLDTYDPFRPMRIFAPKNRANIRIVHLLKLKMAIG